MMVAPTVVNTIVVGGGHAGVNLACMLEIMAEQNNGSSGREHEYLILERAPSLLNKWRHHRWDHFQLNTPRCFSRLVGQEQKDQTTDVECMDWTLDRPLSEDLLDWDRHIASLHILGHTKLNTNVASVVPQDNGTYETISIGSNGDTTVYKSQNVVVCNGVFDHNTVPKSLADSLPLEIQQHVSGGFSLEHLKPGNVLVVGSSQSGIQLSQILVDHEPDRKVFLACSNAGGCPRSFRGRDLFYWLHRMKFLHITQESLKGMPPEKAEALRYGMSGSPVTGPNRAIAPFSLERQGVTLCGRFCGSEGKKLRFQNDRCESLKAAKAGHDKIVGMIREFATKLEAEAGESFPEEEPEPEWEVTNEFLLTDPGDLELDIKEAGITNVLWTCGWSSDLSWLKVDQTRESNDFDERTHLPSNIVSKDHPGLFFLGYPWIGTIQSMNVLNMERDAKIICENLR